MRSSVTSPAPSAARKRRGRARVREEGAVLLVVLLFLMVATASAAISVRSTQAEIQYAGQERVYRQARAGSEAAMTTTLAWVDMIGQDKWTEVFMKGANSKDLPDYTMFGAAPVDVNNRHMAGRMTAQQQAGIRTNEWMPMTNAADPSDATADRLGSFGPRQAYGVLSNASPYSVDLTDCQEAPAANNAGNEVSKTEEGYVWVQYYCVLTVNFGLTLPTDTTTVAWAYGGSTYNQPAFGTFNQSRATILSPNTLVPVTR